MARRVAEWEEAGKSPSLRFVGIYRESFVGPAAGVEQRDMCSRRRTGPTRYPGCRTPAACEPGWSGAGRTGGCQARYRTPATNSPFVAGRMQRHAAAVAGHDCRASVSPLTLTWSARPTSRHTAPCRRRPASSPSTCQGSIACRSSSTTPRMRYVADQREAELEVRGEPFVLERHSRASRSRSSTSRKSCCDEMRQHEPVVQLGAPADQRLV